MSNLAPTATLETCFGDPAVRPVLEALPGRLTELNGLAIRRLLPRSQRRLVGPWCFLDSFGPLTFSSSKAMDVAPHPHIGLQTVSWLLDGEVLHNDSLGLEGVAAPGVLNLMTAGSGIAHAEETPPENSGRLMGLQLWVALPEGQRGVAPAFAQHRALPIVELDGGRATIIIGELSGVRSPARTIFADVGRGGRGRTRPVSRASYGPRLRTRLGPAAGRVLARWAAACDRHAVLPGLRATGADPRLGTQAGTSAAFGGRPVWRDRPHVVELRRPHERRDHRGS